MSYKDEAQKSHTSKLKGYADGGVVDAKLAAAKQKLGTRMKQYEEEGADMTLAERDRRDRTQEAWRSGDYAPSAKGGYTYKPWSPKRGED